MCHKYIRGSFLCRLRNVAQCFNSAVPTSQLSSSTSSTSHSGQALVEPSPLPCEDFGQPLPQTHPHLLQYGEVTPGIQRDEFRTRRLRLCENILRSVPGRDTDRHVNRHLILVSATGKKFMSEKIPYVFRQSTDFLYLSGCMEPDSLLCIYAESDFDYSSTRKVRSTLFLNGRDSSAERWEGPRTGTDRAVDVYGVDEALPHSELQAFLASHGRGKEPIGVWYDYANPVGMNVHPKVMEFLQGRWHDFLESPRRLIQRSRLIKSEAEIRLMRRSCEIASDSLTNVMRFTTEGRSEGDLWAKMEFDSRLKGADYLAYPPVVAGGRRANTIHYINNNQILRDGEMVLMDAGCYLHGYCSDVTRTWPVSGRFSRYQRALYEMLLKVQKEILQIASTHPSLDTMFKAMCQILGSECQHLGVLPRSLSPSEASAKAYSLCPHHVSHYLGMDVHDTGLIPRNIHLEPGMVITVEPGIYLDEKNTDVPAEFRGMGIRIEDDVLVTDTGISVLTSKCPTSVEGIEAACSNLRDI